MIEKGSSSELSTPVDIEQTIKHSDHYDEFDEFGSDIGTSNTIHDQFQFESKFDFDLTSDEGEEKKLYEIDFYFFLPKSMGIKSDTYSLQNFYADLTNHLRIRTPEFSQWNHIHPDKWNLPATDRYFHCHLITHQRQQLTGLVIQEVKLFGSFVNTRLKKSQEDIYSAFDKGSEAWRYHQLASVYKQLEHLVQIIKAYREYYMHIIKDRPILTDEEVRKAFLLVDEYVSYRIEDIFIRLYERLSSEKDLNIRSLLDFLDTVLKHENTYRIHAKLADMNDLSSDQVMTEIYYYRMGLLKKYVSEVLYLQVENIKKEQTYRNFIAAVGAALAALWAGLIDFQRIQYQTQHAGDLGFRIFIIIMVGVIAYIFKDRIKELSKEYFNEKLKHHLPDLELQMNYRYFDETGEERKNYLGSSREYARYISKASLPPEIYFIRDLGHRIDVDPERNEEVIHYSKKINFKLDNLRESLADIRYIKDIVRFDISDFLAKLDNPNKALRYYDMQDGIQRVDAPKVYHLNVVFRYATSHQDNKGKWQKKYVEFERIRIILNKKGIVRIEPVLPRGDMNYLEEIEPSEK